LKNNKNTLYVSLLGGIGHRFPSLEMNLLVLTFAFSVLLILAYGYKKIKGLKTKQINQKHLIYNVLAHRTRPKNLKRNLFTGTEGIYSPSLLSKTSMSPLFSVDQNLRSISKELIFTTPRLGSINATNVKVSSSDTRSVRSSSVESLASIEANSAPLGPLPVIRAPSRTDQRTKTKKEATLLKLARHSSEQLGHGFVTPLNSGSVNVNMQPVVIKQTLSTPTAPLVTQNEVMEMEECKSQRINTRRSDEKTNQSSEETLKRKKSQVGNNAVLSESKKRKADPVPRDLEEELEANTKRRRKVNEKKRKKLEHIPSDENEDETHSKKRKTVRGQAKRNTRNVVTSSSPSNSTKSKKKANEPTTDHNTAAASNAPPASSSTNKENHSLDTESKNMANEKTLSKNGKTSPQEAKSNGQQKQHVKQISEQKLVASTVSHKNANEDQAPSTQPKTSISTNVNTISASTSSANGFNTPKVSSPTKENSVSSENSRGHSKSTKQTLLTEEIPKIDVSLLSSQTTPLTKQGRVAFTTSNSSSAKKLSLRISGSQKVEQVIVPEEEEDKRVQSLLESAAKSSSIVDKNSKKELKSIKRNLFGDFPTLTTTAELTMATLPTGENLSQPDKPNEISSNPTEKQSPISSNLPPTVVLNENGKNSTIISNQSNDQQAQGFSFMSTPQASSGTRVNSQNIGQQESQHSETTAISLKQSEESQLQPQRPLGVAINFTFGGLSQSQPQPQPQQQQPQPLQQQQQQQQQLQQQQQPQPQQLQQQSSQQSQVGFIFDFTSNNNTKKADLPGNGQNSSPVFFSKPIGFSIENQPPTPFQQLQPQPQSQSQSQLFKIDQSSSQNVNSQQAKEQLVSTPEVTLSHQSTTPASAMAKQDMSAFIQQSTQQQQQSQAQQSQVTPTFMNNSTQAPSNLQQGGFIFVANQTAATGGPQQSTGLLNFGSQIPQTAIANQTVLISNPVASNTASSQQFFSTPNSGFNLNNEPFKPVQSSANSTSDVASSKGFVFNGAMNPGASKSTDNTFSNPFAPGTTQSSQPFNTFMPGSAQNSQTPNPFAPGNTQNRQILRATRRKR
jgi:hypothetical protein